MLAGSTIAGGTVCTLTECDVLAGSTIAGVALYVH